MSNTQKSNLDTDAPSESATSDSDNPSSQDTDLSTEVDLLAAENRRLRELVAASQRSRYRNTALALCGVGLLCGLIGLIVPAGSTVLFALAGTGLFGGVLTYFLTPERFISADVGQQVYTATAESFERLCTDLGLSERRIYLSASSDSTSEADELTRADTIDSWLFVPQTEDTSIPHPSEIDSGFLVEQSRRGLSVRPTGSRLFATFNRSLTEPLGTTAGTLCEQLADAVIEDFELAQNITYDVDLTDGRISVQITDALYGAGNRFDHPIVSLLAVGFATGLETPVEATVTNTDPLSVTFRWDSAES